MGVVSQYSGNSFGNPWPTIRTLPLPATDAAFNATCPDKWLSSMGDIDRQRPTDRLNDLCYRFFTPQSRNHDDQFTVMLEQELKLFNTYIEIIGINISMVTRVLSKDFTLIHDENLERIHAQFDVLRSTCPVAHTKANGGYWIRSRYEDVQRCATNHEMFVSSSLL